jgi:hypothetical protein
MERKLAENFMRELSEMGDHFKRLNELVDAHVAELLREFRLPLAGAMAGAAVLTEHVAKLYPDLDPDKLEKEQAEEPACSFCGKPQGDVLQLIGGAPGFICNECVQLCARVVVSKHPEWREQLDLSPLE